MLTGCEITVDKATGERSAIFEHDDFDIITEHPSLIESLAQALITGDDVTLTTRSRAEEVGQDLAADSYSDGFAEGYRTAARDEKIKHGMEEAIDYAKKDSRALGFEDAKMAMYNKISDQLDAREEGKGEGRFMLENFSPKQLSLVSAFIKSFHPK